MPVRLLSTCLTILSALVCLSGCQKKEDEPAPQSRAELLVGPKWHVKAWRLSVRTFSTATGPGTIQPTVLTSNAQSCDIDDVDVYQANGGMQTDHGTLKCQPADPQTKTGTWELVDNETKLSYIFGPSEPVRVFTINQLTATTLDITQTRITTSGGYTTEYEFNLQQEARP